MISKYFPPEITPAVISALKTLKRRFIEDAECLATAECPAETKSFLREVFRPQSTSTGGATIGTLENEVTELYLQLKSLNPGVEDTKEGLQYARTATSLLEKLITLREKASGVAEIDAFKRTVIDILQDYLPPESRTSVIERLKNASN